jgi:hypothetical protein
MIENYFRVVGFEVRSPISPSAEQIDNCPPRPSGLLHKELSKCLRGLDSVHPRDEWVDIEEYRLAKDYSEALEIGKSLGRSHREHARAVRDIQSTGWPDCLVQIDRARELIQRHSVWFGGLNFPALFELLDYAKERFENRRVFLVSGTGAPRIIAMEFYKILSVAEVAGTKMGLTDYKIALLRRGFSFGYALERDFALNDSDMVFFRSYWRCRRLEHYLKVVLEPKDYSPERVARAWDRLNLIIVEINRETSGCVST